MAKVHWTGPALRDLRAVFDFIATDSQSYAERFCGRLIERVERLESYPLSGHQVPEFEEDRDRRLRETREIPFGGYRILYVVRRSNCYITSVMHGSRDLSRHVDPDDWDIPPESD